MDKKTQILIGVSGAALLGGLVYYFRAKNQQTDVLSLLKVDLKKVGSQVGVVPKKRVPVPPIKTGTGGRPTGGGTRPTGTGNQTGGQTGPNVPPDIKPPKEGGYGVQGYGQQGNQDGQSGGGQGYGGDIGGYIQGYGDGYGQGYGETGGYGLSGGDITEYGYGDQTQNQQYEPEPCKPSYGTGDWIVNNECLGR